MQLSKASIHCMVVQLHIEIYHTGGNPIPLYQPAVCRPGPMDFWLVILQFPAAFFFCRSVIYQSVGQEFSVEMMFSCIPGQRLTSQHIRGLFLAEEGAGGRVDMANVVFKGGERLLEQHEWASHLWHEIFFFFFFFRVNSKVVQPACTWLRSKTPLVESQPFVNGASR